MQKLLLAISLSLISYFFSVASPDNWSLSICTFSKIDTLPAKPKYQGFRIHLSNFKVQKRTGSWVKLNFNAVNTGRQNIDFSKREQHYWVQFNFDQTIYDQKLGGLKEQIKEALFDQKFKLAAGKLVKNHALKVSTLPPSNPVIKQKEAPVVQAKSIPAKEEETAPEAENTFTTKGNSVVTTESIQEEKDQCPDITIDTVIVLDQSKKWATFEFTLKNIGKGPIQIYGNKDGDKENLAIRGFISGVPRLSKGALPLGGKFIRGGLEATDGQLLPNETYVGKIKLDVSKKTRYMRALILSLNGRVLNQECDRTNNTFGLQLDL